MVGGIVRKTSSTSRYLVILKKVKKKKKKKNTERTQTPYKFLSPLSGIYTRTHKYTERDPAGRLKKGKKKICWPWRQNHYKYYRTTLSTVQWNSTCWTVLIVCHQSIGFVLVFFKYLVLFENISLETQHPTSISKVFFYGVVWCDQKMHSCSTWWIF